jgi:FkbM family methyltransferase
MLEVVPESTMKILEACKSRAVNISERYPGLKEIAEEILCSAHGLETLDPRGRRYVREKAAMDIGAFDGDSAVVLGEYAKEVYSFEPGPTNFRILVRVADLNRHHFGKIHTLNLGLSDKPGKMTIEDKLDSGVKIGRGDAIVNTTTLDLFVEQNGIQVGLVKCDTECHGLPIIRGAEQTLKRQRPVVSLAVYHNADEMFGIPPLLRHWLPNYEFAWNYPIRHMWRKRSSMFPTDVYSAKSSSGPPIPAIFEIPTKNDFKNNISSFRTARSTSSLLAELHQVSDNSIGGAFGFIKSNFELISEEPNFCSTIVGPISQIYLERISEGFRGSSEVVPIEFYLNTFAEYSHFLKNPRSVYFHPEPSDVPDFSNLSRSSNSLNLIWDSKKNVYAARLQQPSGGIGGHPTFPAILIT